jgi:hypothetical protein
MSAVKRVESVSGRMSYATLINPWFHIIVLKVHAPTEDTIDDVKGIVYEELEHAFDNLPKYHMTFLLREFNAKVGRKDLFKLAIGNESSHDNNNYNGIRLAANISVKNTMFPSSINILELLQMGIPTIILTTFL